MYATPLKLPSVTDCCVAKYRDVAIPNPFYASKCNQRREGALEGMRIYASFLAHISQRSYTAAKFTLPNEDGVTAVPVASVFVDMVKAEVVVSYIDLV